MKPNDHFMQNYGNTSFCLRELDPRFMTLDVRKARSYYNPETPTPSTYYVVVSEK